MSNDKSAGMMSKGVLSSGLLNKVNHQALNGDNPEQKSLQRESPSKLIVPHPLLDGEDIEIELSVDDDFMKKYD